MSNLNESYFRLRSTAVKICIKTVGSEFGRTVYIVAIAIYSVGYFFFILSQDFTFHPKGISILLDPQKGPVIFHENVLLL